MIDATRTDAAADHPPAHTTLGANPTVCSDIVPPDGYELYEQVGAGGMGVVYRARDLELDREVAVKLLAVRYDADSTTAKRFVDEARITGQLQHPSVPAVYRVGRTADGRPFLAMKLIRGKTLDQLVRDGGVNALAVIEAVAQGVGYAHSHGVIHRDLKPTNVMVGKFGEVQVMDWGLAKSLLVATPPLADESATDETFVPPEVGRRGSDSSLTQAGSVLGTLAFMPPEQAAGEIDRVDRRADVFGLGGILCFLLTGKPPYDVKGQDALRAAAIRGDTADAFRRLDGSGAEPGVVALCKTCLAFNRDDRPADGKAVAEAVAELRADADERARQAEVSRAKSEVEAAEARKRRRTLVIAMTVTLAVFTAGIVGTTVGYFRADDARRNAVLAERGEAEQRGRAEQAVQGEAEQRVKAQERLKKAVDAVEKMMARVSTEKWALRPELQAERREMLAEAVAFFRGFDEIDSRDPYVRRQTARAYTLTMSAYMTLAEYANCGEAADAAHELYRGLVADDAKDEVAQRGLIDCLSMRGHLASIAGKYALAERHYEASLAAAEAAAAANPESEDLQVVVADTHMSLGLFNGIRRPELTIRHHEAALRIGEQLLRGPSPGYRARMVVFSSLINLASNSLATTQMEGALKMFDRAAELLPYLESNPSPSARVTESFLVGRAALNVYLGAILHRLRRTPDAVDKVRTGVKQIKQLLDVYPKSFPLTVHWMEFQVILADVLVREGKIDEAEQLFVELDRRRKALLDAMPSAAWLARIGVVQQSALVVELAHTGPPAVIARQTERLLETEAMLNAVDEMSGQYVLYNAACVYSLLAARVDPEKAGVYGRRAVELLDGMKGGTFFGKVNNVIHLDQDSDLNPIRESAGYKKFRAAFPPHREVLPPPRAADR